MTSYLPYLRVAKASTISLIQTNENYQLELCQGVINQAALNDLKVVNVSTMDFDWTSGTYDSVNSQLRRDQWDAALQSAIDQNVDALVICDYTAAEYALSYLKNHNWTPKSLTLSTLYAQFTDPSLLDFVTSTTSYSPQARFPAQALFTDSVGYNSLVQAKYGGDANQIMARATLAGMIWTNALLQASANTSDAISNALSTNQFASFMGTSAMDAAHRQTLASLVIQYLSNATISNVIGPALAADDALIYPMPTWSERIFNPKWGSGVEIAGAVLMALGGASTVAWVIFLFVHWRHRVIVAASPLFLLTILLGSLVVYISIFNWMPNLISDSVCALRAWLLPIGFMAMFGSLLAKTHRIHRLYNSEGINIIVIRNSHVALQILGIVVGQAVLSVLMITVTNLKSDVHVVDVYRISLNYRVCTFSVALKILLGINIGYAFALLIWGTYLAYCIRKVPISIYDESKIIAFSIYNTVFFACIVIVIQLAVGNSSRSLTFMITAVCCFLGAMVTTACLFGAKVFAIYRPGKDSRSSVTSVTSSSGNSRGNSPHSRSAGGSAAEAADDAAARKYKKKYKSLKSKNKDLQERIRQLETLAKSNGFLHSEDEDVEMGAPITTTNGNGHENGNGHHHGKPISSGASKEDGIESDSDSDSE